MNEFTSVDIELPRRPTRQDLLYRKVRRLGFPLLPIAKPHRPLPEQEWPGRRFKTERESLQRTQHQNEFMDELSEPGRQSVILAARREISVERTQNPSTPRQPRLSLLPRLKGQSSPQPLKKSTINCLLVHDQLVTFYPHKLSPTHP